MKKMLLIAMFVLILSGCGSVRGLMHYSSEQDALQRYVSDQRKKVERLFEDIDNEKIVVGSLTTKEAVCLYGDPILIKNQENGERWLYRKAMEYFNTRKVYFLFDNKGVLLDFEVVSPES